MSDIDSIGPEDDEYDDEALPGNLSPVPAPGAALATGRRVFSIPDGLDGCRLDRALAELLGDRSRTQIKALIEARSVTLADESAALCSEPALKVKAGQSFAMMLPEALDMTLAAEAIALSVVFEDADVIVIDKPAGMVVHPAPGSPNGTLVNALLHHCGASLAGIGGVRRPGIVHRLDKDTSGLIVAAKSEAAHQGLVRQFAERVAGRRYRALVWGRPTPPVGEIDGAIGRAAADRKKMAVTRNGKPALTRYKFIEPAGGTCSLMECKLATGRTHQIRVHMAHIGHPLVGDPLYGRPTRRRADVPDDPAKLSALLGFKRQALHAASLAFTHPVSGKPMEFHCDLPQDMADLLVTLQG